MKPTKKQIEDWAKNRCSHAAIMDMLDVLMETDYIRWHEDENGVAPHWEGNGVNLGEGIGT